MSEITLTLTEEQVKFLKQFAAKQYHGAKDNLCTGYPIHMVETKRYDYVPYHPDIAWAYEDNPLSFTYDEDYELWFEDEKEMVEEWREYSGDESEIEIKTFEELKGNRVENPDGMQMYVNNYEDYFKMYGVKLVAMSWKKPYYEKVAPFFILEEAKRYIEYQRHNLHKPRVYTYGAGYANYGDFTHFWEVLMQAGSELNKTEKKVEENV